jgi:hypothetical protein
VNYDLLCEEVIKKPRSLNIHQSCSVGRWYSKEVLHKQCFGRIHRCYCMGGRCWR